MHARYAETFSAFPSHKAHRMALISVSLAFGQTPAYTARKLIQMHGFAYTGPAMWNHLPRLVRRKSPQTAFKCQLKTVLFSNAFIIVLRLATTVFNQLHLVHTL